MAAQILALRDELEPVTESARAHSYILSKQVQKTCKIWLLTFWLLTVPSALRLDIVSKSAFTIYIVSEIAALRAFLGHLLRCDGNPGLERRASGRLLLLSRGLFASAVSASGSCCVVSASGRTLAVFLSVWKTPINREESFYQS